MRSYMLIFFSLFASLAHADLTLCSLEVVSPRGLQTVEGSEMIIDPSRPFNILVKTFNNQMFRLATKARADQPTIDEVGYLSFHAIGLLKVRDTWVKVDSLKLSDANRAGGVRSRTFKLHRDDGNYEVFAECKKITAEEALIKAFNKALKKSEVAD